MKPMLYQIAVGLGMKRPRVRPVARRQRSDPGPTGKNLRSK